MYPIRRIKTMKTRVSTTVRLTKVEEVGLLPDIECSAGQSFRDWPQLAWIADEDDMSPEAHLQYVQKGTSWVAEVDSQIAGFLCAEVMSGYLHVWELAVRREWQGQGIGRRLMETAIEYARRHQFRWITLTTFRQVPWNEPFYRQLGFEIINTKDMDPRLVRILQHEALHGLPADLRCAMRLVVLSAQEQDLQQSI
jgi:GNAT superfamily N-acetyltransferase